MWMVRLNLHVLFWVHVFIIHLSCRWSRKSSSYTLVGSSFFLFSFFFIFNFQFSSEAVLLTDLVKIEFSLQRTWIQLNICEQGYSKTSIIVWEMQTKRIKGCKTVCFSGCLWRPWALYMFSVGFLGNIVGPVWVAAWSAFFPEKKPNFLLSSQMAEFTKMKALELCRG